jgi:hypothetical protein
MTEGAGRFRGRHGVSIRVVDVNALGVNGSIRTAVRAPLGPRAFWDDKGVSGIEVEINVVSDFNAFNLIRINLGD